MYANELRNEMILKKFPFEILLIKIFLSSCRIHNIPRIQKKENPSNSYESFTSIFH